MKTRKILALLLVLVMMAGLLSMSAFATTSSTASFTFTGDSNVTTATVAGGGTGTLKILDTLGPDTEDDVKTCQLELSPNSTASSATITLKNGSTTVATLTATLPTAVPTETSVTSVDTTINGTTYIFTFVKETSYTTGTNNGGVYISLPDDGVTLGTVSQSGNTYTYASAKTYYSGFPQYVSLRLVPGGSSYDSITNLSVTLDTTNSTTDVAINHQAGTAPMSRNSAN